MNTNGPIYEIVEKMSKQKTMGDDLSVGRVLAFEELLPIIQELEPVETKSLIKTKSLTTLEDFKSLKKGDYVACTFHRDIPFYKTRFRVFEIYENKERCDEIILERRNNIYFNYKMFLSGESYLKDILLISE